MSRFSTLFSHLHDEGAFVPFLMLGDPSPEDSLDIVCTLVAAGADALELGVPFSDPVADGPTIQASHVRALAGGVGLADALELIRTIREEFPRLPLGILVYGNVPFSRGLDAFYREFAEAGADAILLPDIPVREGAPFVAAAERAGVDPVFIAPAQASEAVLESVATHSRGYIYAVSRDGVTGAEKQSETTGLRRAVEHVARFGGAPILLGFGISRPEHVRAAVRAGAAGAITGSAITRIIERHCVPDPSRPSHSEHGLPAFRVGDPTALRKELSDYVREMKKATL
ncbi:tryptophan synthase subunit alpha [Corynebacterium sp. zg-331]|uniref:tryptophan synthase subunit alpha n=1 Tax=unclassified Corynebacterium TaxID=2624378 RepID=UPI00128BEAC0|nr:MULTISPECIES: tryptophan synthase subunit alpha [unclassified Corynebacterium]MBC3186503.1 tryptophan synthase subunit alpha [Corynebacterium sp. zg-331]MPV52988.1 tryptophan synthase subunit alpha [Corynebacterium sp. zg331]